MSTQAKILRAYHKALKHLPGSREKNEEYRAYIRDSIQEVFASRPDAGVREIHELFGDPETAKNSYIQSLTQEELELGRREHGKNRKRKLALLLPACLILAVFTGFVIRSYFFPVVDIAIAFPTNQDAEKYIERPMLIGTGSFFGKSANRILQERLFIDNVSVMEAEIARKYPAGYHVTCAVESGNGNTTVFWTGTGTTADGIEEDIHEQYVCPYKFHIHQGDELSGEAAARARYAVEATRQAIQEMG